MNPKLFNWAIGGLVAASLMLPATASAQRSRGDAPAAGGAVPRDSSPPPAPAAPPASGGGSDGGSSRAGGDSNRGSGSTGNARSRAGSGNRDGRRGDSGQADSTRGSRPRGDRNPTRQAVERRPGSGGGTIIVPGGGYFPWGWGGLGFGGYYGGYYGGLYDGWGFDPYQGGGYSSGGGYDGSLRIKVKPREAMVFIDGYFAGEVDQFDGAFQRLRIDGGPHRVEIRLDGYEPLVFEINIQPDRTVTYKGELQKLP